MPALLKSTSEVDLVKAIKELNKTFTSMRSRIGNYVLNELEVSAYAAFYLPTNIQKFYFLLSQLETQLSGPFIDFGSGPGTFALAILKHFGADSKVVSVDSSTLMLEQAKKLKAHLGPFPNWSIQSNLDRCPKEACLIFGQVVNEMGVKEASSVIDKLQPSQIVVIEPGTSAAFLEVSELRKELINRDFKIAYPCASVGPCPALEIKSEWCHQVWRGTHHPSIERLSQMASLDRRTMPFIAHVYSRVDQNLSAIIFRFLKETKFSFEWQICDHNRSQKLINVEILKKGIEKTAIKKLQSIGVGHRIEYAVKKELAPDRWRIELKTIF